jgi:hypothetical protein
LPRRPRDQLLDLGQQRMNRVALGTLRTRIRRQASKSSARFFE